MESNPKSTANYVNIEGLPKDGKLSNPNTSTVPINSSIIQKIQCNVCVGKKVFMLKDNLGNEHKIVLCPKCFGDGETWPNTYPIIINPNPWIPMEPYIGDPYCPNTGIFKYDTNIFPGMKDYIAMNYHECTGLHIKHDAKTNRFIYSESCQ